MSDCTVLAGGNDHAQVQHQPQVSGVWRLLRAGVRHLQADGLHSPVAGQHRARPQGIQEGQQTLLSAVTPRQALLLGVSGCLASAGTPLSPCPPHPHPTKAINRTPPSSVSPPTPPTKLFLPVPLPLPLPTATSALLVPLSPSQYQQHHQYHSRIMVVYFLSMLYWWEAADFSSW